MIIRTATTTIGCTQVRNQTDYCRPYTFLTTNITTLAPHKAVKVNVKKFTFNPFSENTYILSDETKECVIIDPGCNTEGERNELSDYISSKGLSPVLLINTHCHIDHVLGNKYVSKKYNLPLGSHEGEKVTLSMQPQVSMMYGIPYDTSPEITITYKEGDEITFGNQTLEVIYAPGHSPAHICLYHKKSDQLIAGDVLFNGSIGRTDLPGGNHDLLLQNIKEKLYCLPQKTVVYCGHGPNTTIGHESLTNPFVRL